MYKREFRRGFLLPAAETFFVGEFLPKGRRDRTRRNGRGDIVGVEPLVDLFQEGSGRAASIPRLPASEDFHNFTLRTRGTRAQILSKQDAPFSISVKRIAHLLRHSSVDI